MPTPTPPNPPNIGDKVFLPELNVWGEIVEFYDDNKDLITRVRAMVNGKPTFVDVTGLIVDIANVAAQAAGLWGRIKTAAKSLCQKLGLCKQKPAPVVPAALVQKIEQLKAEDISIYDADYFKNTRAIELLEKYLSKQ